MKLAIISHTEHYRNSQGQIVGWGPTVSEINHLAAHFVEIYHLAMLHTSEPPPSSLPYVHSNITFVVLPASGGTSIFSKLKILWQAPKTIGVVCNTLKKADVFQLRAPTGIGVYLIPYLTWFSGKKGWYKYAGNWSQENPPLGYRLQRSFLKKQSRKVTINGTWPDQPKHCYTFENPCLTLAERSEGVSIIKQKKYEAPFAFCFVGRLDDAKGVQRIIDAFAKFENKSMIAAIHFIGNGEHLEDYKQQCKQLKLPATFHGFLPRTQVFDIYRRCQFLLLPSTASEGFPKVIAEGMNYGCIPIVSNVSSIGQYIQTENGFVVCPTKAEVLLSVIEAIETTPVSVLEKKAMQGYATASKFTFEHYNSRILNEIIAT